MTRVNIQWHATFLLVLCLWTGDVNASENGGKPTFTLQVRQLTSGPQHHFFGYIGHVQNIPWNGDDRYILALRTPLQDRLPTAKDPADIILIDTRKDDALQVLDQTRAWNPQQGTMLYWNPLAPKTQFFFNDRDPETGRVFCVLFDIGSGSGGKRLREYRFDTMPIGNGGVAQNGGYFLGINYGRMARLRPVTGYAGAYDWTVGVPHPPDDGIFRVDVETGSRKLLVSFERLAETLRPRYDAIQETPLFINHTLWNREGDRIFFFARGHFGNRDKRINVPFTMNPDGSGLKPLGIHIGGHPEWDYGRRMIGRLGERQIVYDTDRDLVIGDLGNPEIFPDPEGDIALSPDGQWFVNGFKDREKRENFYTVYRRSDGEHLRSPGFSIGDWVSGNLRMDPGPCWNRAGTRLLVPGLTGEGSGTRQMFLLQIVPSTEPDSAGDNR